MFDWQTLYNGTILLVDDEPDNLEVVAETLEFNGLNVTMAQNGVEALKMIESSTPVLIVTDLSMPEMDGWELRTRVRSRPELQAIPIVALSAHAMAGDKDRAINAGFDGYMTKPVNVMTLIDDLRSILCATSSQGEN